MDILLLYMDLSLFVVVPLLLRTRIVVACSIVALWTSMLVVFYYIAIPQLGGGTPVIELFGVVIPLWLVVPLATVLSLAASQQRYRASSLMVVAIGAILLSYTRGFSSFNAWLLREGTTLHHVVFSRTFITPFAVCALLPVLVIQRHNPSWYRAAFFPYLTELKADIRHLWGPAILWILVIVISKLVVEKSLLLNLVLNPLALSSAMVTYLVGWILIDHVISFALVPHAVRVISSDYAPGISDVLLGGIIFVGLHYYFSVPYLIITLLEGLIYGYIVLKTQRLVYGVILSMVAHVVFGL